MPRLSLSEEKELLGCGLFLSIFSMAAFNESSSLMEFDVGSIDLVLPNTGNCFAVPDEFSIDELIT